MAYMGSLRLKEKNFILVCKEAQEGYQMYFMVVEKSRKRSWFCNFLMLERQRIYSS